VHQYIRAVLTYAVTHELAEVNHARDIQVNDIIPKRKTKNQTRIDLKELPQLLRDIEAYDGYVVTKCAIKLLALTAVRTKELIEGEWEEVDWQGKVWRIAPERMKMKVVHIVPLSTQALTILRELRNITGGNRYMFPSVKGDGRTMSNNTILYALYRMGYHSRMTGHGFRGVFSTSLNEQGYDERHIELQLSHLYGGEVKRAYDHSKHLVERAKMMQDWADYLDVQRSQGLVIKMRAGGGV
jgi:integrase